MIFLFIVAILLIVGYIIFITIENTSLSGTNNRLRTELSFTQRQNKKIVEPLIAISKQEPLTALKMLRDHLENNK